MMVWFIPRRLVLRQICLRVFSFGETGYIILLAGHAGKAWSDLVSKTAQFLLLAHDSSECSHFGIVKNRK